MDLSKNIKTIREKLKMKQSEIAKKLEMEPPNYSRLESRGNKLTFEQLEQIASALGVSVLEIIQHGESQEDFTEIVNDLKRENTAIKEALNTLKSENGMLKELLEDKKQIIALLTDEHYFALYSLVSLIGDDLYDELDLRHPELKNTPKLEEIFEKEFWELDAIKKLLYFKLVTKEQILKWWKGSY